VKADTDALLSRRIIMVMVKDGESIACAKEKRPRGERIIISTASESGGSSITTC